MPSGIETVGDNHFLKVFLGEKLPFVTENVLVDAEASLDIHAVTRQYMSSLMSPPLHPVGPAPGSPTASSHVPQCVRTGSGQWQVGAALPIGRTA